MLTYGKFKFFQVHTEDLLNEIYRLRYEVYVKEFGFERAEDHPDGYETDEYEHASIHFASTNGNDKVIGTLRMVFHSEKGFPIEHATELSLPNGKPSPDRTAEISRLAVSRLYRRRQEDGQFGVESYLKKSEGGILPEKGAPPPDMRKRETPIIVLGLYQAMYQEAKRRGIAHLYMITEEKLYHALKRFGIHFKRIGEPVEYHGIRIPYLGNIKEMEKILKEDYPGMLKMMLIGLEEKYHPFT